MSASYFPWQSLYYCFVSLLLLPWVCVFTHSDIGLHRAVNRTVTLDTRTSQCNGEWAWLYNWLKIVLVRSLVATFTYKNTFWKYVYVNNCIVTTEVNQKGLPKRGFICIKKHILSEFSYFTPIEAKLSYNNNLFGQAMHMEES